MSGDPDRPLTDPRALRALAHPVRLALLELLATGGPLTATEAGAQLGESPSNCSFHLRTLARYGFVAEATGGRGRQRPWRRINPGVTIATDELDPDDRPTGAALIDLLHAREAARLATWTAVEHTFPAAWRSAAVDHHALVHVTAAELATLGSAIQQLLRQYTGREPGSRPADAMPVALVVHGVPIPASAEPVPRKARPADEH